MTMPSSFNVSGLLGGTAGSIDTTTLISQLMQAQAIPQTQLQTQLTTLQQKQAAYQQINTDVTALQTAAQALTDPSGWTATTATSSSSSVAASATSSAVPGSTTFNVTQLAKAQISTVAGDSSGNVVSDPTSGINLTVGTTTTNVALTSGSATDVAAAINAANLGVRASVVSTDNGNVLQLSSAQTGTANAFSVTGFDATPQNLVTAQNAQITVGDPNAGGYTVSSSSNTFTGFIPGVTFSVAGVASDVTVTVANDEAAASKKVQTLVNAANTVMSDLAQTLGQGDMLEGDGTLQSLSSAILSSVSNGGPGGASLSSYGISLDSKGNLSFDPTAFASAYSADPTGTQTAVSGSFATALKNTSTTAVAPSTGTLTQIIASNTTQASSLNTQITNWTTRLNLIQSSLQAKYGAMQTALAKLQSTQTYLTSMFDSINGTSSSSSSSK